MDVIERELNYSYRDDDDDDDDDENTTKIQYNNLSVRMLCGDLFTALSNQVTDSAPLILMLRLRLNVSNHKEVMKNVFLYK
jgi:hypothetical protein